MQKKILSFVLACFTVSLIIGAVSMSSAYFILRHNLMAKLQGQERASVLIAEQIKTANLNSILAFTDQYFIFIVHQRDGRLLFESAKRSGAQLEMWEENKEGLIKELLALRSGELRYPARKPWQILLPLTNVRYIELPELEWVVATELPAAITFDQLLSVYSPTVASGIFGFCLILAWYLSFYNNKQEKFVPFAQELKEPLPEKPQHKVHPVHTEEYTQRLISAAQKALESDPAPLTPIAAGPSPASVTPKAHIVPEKPENVIEEIEIKDHIKGAADKVRQEEAQPQVKPLPVKPLIIKNEEVDQLKQKELPLEHETKKPSEIYFEHIISGTKQKKEKPKPASIIGMALSKKKNREDVDS